MPDPQKLGNFKNNSEILETEACNQPATQKKNVHICARKFRNLLL